MSNAHLNELFRDANRMRVFWHTAMQPMSVLRLSLEEPEVLIPAKTTGPIHAQTLLPFRSLATRASLFTELIRFTESRRDLAFTAPRESVDLREVLHQSLTYIQPIAKQEHLVWEETVFDTPHVKGDVRLLKLALKCCFYLASVRSPFGSTWTIRVKGGACVFKRKPAHKASVIEPVSFSVTQLFLEEHPIIAESEWLLWAIHEIVSTLHLGTMTAQGTFEDIQSITLNLSI